MTFGPVVRLRAVRAAPDAKFAGSHLLTSLLVQRRRRAQPVSCSLRPALGLFFRYAVAERIDDHPRPWPRTRPGFRDRRYAALAFPL
jgi:hypothetical protein